MGGTTEEGQVARFNQLAGELTYARRARWSWNRHEATSMQVVVLVVAIIALSGCSGIEQDASHLQQQQDAISAAVKKIKVVPGVNVKGNPQYTALGRVEGYCFNRPNSTGGETVHGDGLKTAAYRKYGGQVDAIVNTSVWFVSDDSSPAFEPYTENGYFECSGTAVHFTEEPAPALAPKGPPDL
jgi:hypothetical protein